MGQIIKRGDKFKAIVSVTQAHQRHRVSRTFDRKSEARDWLIAIEEQKRKGDIYTYSDQDLPAYFKVWYETYKEPTINEVTQRRYQSTMNLVDKYWQSRALNSITYDDYQKFINKLADKYKLTTVKKIHTQLRAGITKAFQLHKIRDNFTDGAQLSGKASKPSHLKYLELNDISALKAYCLNNINKMDNCPEIMILTSLLTGIRYEEAIGLTWHNLDLANAVMHIKQSYDYVSQQFMPTKTPSSVRDISMDSELIAALKKWRTIINAYQLKTQFRNPHNFVFFTRQKNVPSNSYLNNRLKKYYQANLIHKPITYHGLRHSHASFLISQGISIQYISKRLGHGNIAITEQVYAHLLKSAENHEDQLALEALKNI